MVSRKAPNEARRREGARWIVLMQPIEMSNAQIQVFKNIFRDNHRPLQKSGGREVDRESD